jgi:hypothetical protein
MQQRALIDKNLIIKWDYFNKKIEKPIKKQLALQIEFCYFNKT